MSLISIINENVSTENVGQIPPILSYNIMAKGDSLTADEIGRQICGAGPVYEGFEFPWMYWLEASLNNNTKYPYFQNFATAGESIFGGMDCPTDVAEVVNAKKFDVTKNIIFFMAGVNDIQTAGQSPLTVEQTEAAALDIFTKYKNLALKYWEQAYTICAFTILPPRSAVWTNTQTATMRDIAFAFNDLMRAGFNTECKATVLCDIQTHPLMGLYDSNIDHPEYFRPAPDKLHWTELGAQEIADFTIAAMPFLESETVSTIIYS